MNRNKISIALAISAMLGMAPVSHAELHDRGGGLIYDDILDVTWIQDTNLAAGTAYDVFTGEGTSRSGSDTDGKMNWFQAMDWADNLSYYDSVRDVVWDNWRLPSVKCWVNGESFNRNRLNDGSSDVGLNITSPCHELSHLYYVSLGNIGRKDTSGNLQSGAGLIDDPNNPNDESLFIGLDPNDYQYFWTTTIRPDNDSNVFDFRADNGNVAFGNWYYERKAWAVMDGDVGNVTTPDPDPEQPNPTDPDIAVGQITSNIYVPSLDNSNANIWVNFEYHGTTPEGQNLWELKASGANSPAIVDDNNGTYISETQIHLPSVNYRSLDGNQIISIDLSFYGTGPNGEKLWKIDSFQ